MMPPYTPFEYVDVAGAALLLVTTYFFVVRHFYRRLAGARSHKEGAR